MYFRLGLEHITDINGYDHILFLVALCLRYTWQSWKQILWLVTAFTVGHSITLALSTLSFIQVPTAIIEFLIAASIFGTALYAAIEAGRKQEALAPSQGVSPKNAYGLYTVAVFFGLIHGMGFSTLLRSLLNTSEGIVTELLAFNLGLELGQLLIVAAGMLASYIFVSKCRISLYHYVLFVSGGIAALSLQMVWERIPF